MSKKKGFYQIIESDLVASFKNKPSLTYRQFLNCLTTFHFTHKYDFSDLSNKVDEIRNVLYKIASIINKPRIKVTTENVIIRSELAKNISNESFLKTVRDPSLWKKKDYQYEPEKVHTIESIDTIDTYENRFITMLIDILSKELDLVIDEMNLASVSFMSKYKLENVTYSKLSLFNLYKNFTYPFDEDFILRKDDTSLLEDSLYKTSKLLRRIKGSSFYNQLKDNPVIKNVMPTNILLQDSLYSYCYRYYKENLSSAISDYEKEDLMYYNYVICIFMRYFKKYNDKSIFLGKCLKLFTYEDNIIKFKPYIFKDDIFEYTFSQDIDDFSFNVDIKCLIGNLNEEQQVTRYNLKVVRKLYKSNYKKLMQETSNKDINRIIICLFDQDNIYSNVLNLSYFSSDHLKMIKNLFTSFTLLFNISKSESYNRCLCCGNKDISIDNNLISCLKCQSKYLLFDYNKKKYMLIKKLWRSY